VRSHLLGAGSEHAVQKGDGDGRRRLGVSDESEELVGAITCPGLFQGSNSSNKSSASSGVVTLSDEQLQLLEV
jgi:hypothetical protein